MIEPYLFYLTSFLIIGSFFFSLSETAITATSRSFTINKAKTSKKVSILDNLLINKKETISTILIANNVVNILSTAIVTKICIGLYGVNGVLIASLFMTLVIVTLCEIIPKTLAISNPDAIALAIAPIINFFYLLLKVFVKISNVVSNVFLNLFKKKYSPEFDKEKAIKHIHGSVALYHKEGHIIKDDKDMMYGVLKIASLSVSDLMVHRTKIAGIDIYDPENEIIKTIQSSPYTRLIVYNTKIDNVIGVLNIKNIIHYLLKNKFLILNAEKNQTQTNIAEIIKNETRQPWFIPETRSVNQQLLAFKKRKEHFSIIVDEYGEIKGIITLEDIIEEIVGEIVDEHDIPDNQIIKEEDGSFIVEGACSVRDLNKLTNWELPENKANTVAGLLINTAKRLPDKGQCYHFFDFRFEILTKEKNKINLIKIKPLKPLNKT